MGITGLLPLLKSIQNPIHISQYEGKTFAVDGYVWLHKGTFSCAMDLALKKPCKRHIDYCIQRVEMLQSFGVSPYFVFDGGHLPMKLEVEQKRREKREAALALAFESLENGKKSRAYELFQQCVDVTPLMTLDLIRELRKRNIKYVVAPYEADSQLKYMEMSGLVDGIISEDSDLLVYGCEKVIFKMDKNGNGIEICLKNLSNVREIDLKNWTISEFRKMCILSGCDYLKSIHGLGLKKSHKLFNKYKDVGKVVWAAEHEMKMDVPLDYLTKFHHAELTFLHQRIFDIHSNVVRPLNPIDDSVLNQIPTLDYFVGPHIEQSQAIKIATGEFDPIIKEQIYDFLDESFIPLKENNSAFNKMQTFQKKTITKNVWQTDRVSQKHSTTVQNDRSSSKDMKPSKYFEFSNSIMDSEHLKKATIIEYLKSEIPIVEQNNNDQNELYDTTTAYDQVKTIFKEEEVQIHASNAEVVVLEQEKLQLLEKESLVVSGAEIQTFNRNNPFKNIVNPLKRKGLLFSKAQGIKNKKEKTNIEVSSTLKTFFNSFTFK